MSVTPNNSDGRLYQQVAEQLAEAISRGDYPVGTRLPAERKLAERFKVSRPTLREAVIALEIAGYVEVKGGSGVYITGNAGGIKAVESDVSALEVLEARIMFEGEAAGLAAKLISESELEELEETLREMALENEGDTPAESADRKFHLLIAKACKNAAVTSVIEHLWKLRNNSPLSSEVVERVRVSGAKTRIDAHKAILRALRERDSEAAKLRMREHLGQVVEQLLIATEAAAVEAARKQSENSRQRFHMLTGTDRTEKSNTQG